MDSFAIAVVADQVKKISVVSEQEMHGLFGFCFHNWRSFLGTDSRGSIWVGDLLPLEFGCFTCLTT